ncbi:MAG: hypothetical protein ABS95_01165 [Verrucomicrobia bacterium SCN 57-15]|nr:MAG: hypothetical protein ABS95_01165 [Verrucomicrobia bacterium SCN 57-15]
MNADQKQTVRDLIAEIQIRLDFLKTVVNASGSEGNGFTTSGGHGSVPLHVPGKDSPNYAPVTIRRRNRRGQRGINWPS